MGRTGAGFVAVVERRQVAIYLAAIGVGVVVGWAAPGAGEGLGGAISPVLAALLFVTFLQVPAKELVHSLGAGRFMAAVMVVNFLVVPVVVAALVPLLPAERALRLGVLLVLLCPCVDWVVVFSGLAGGRARALLAVTPLLLVAQFLLLPVFLLVFLGPGLGDVVGAGPFAAAFVLLIAVPLVAAWAVQLWASREAGSSETAGLPGAVLAGKMVRGANVLVVPLMVATLVTVVASQVPQVRGSLGALGRVVPVYLLFLVVMAFAGMGVARTFGLDVPAGRAVVFSGAARNSLVVLPLALALPDEFAIGAVAVVTQTLVEAVGMVVYVRIVPHLVVEPVADTAAGSADAAAG